MPPFMQQRGVRAPRHPAGWNTFRRPLPDQASPEPVRRSTSLVALARGFRPRPAQGQKCVLLLHPGVKMGRSVGTEWAQAAWLAAFWSVCRG